MSKKKLIIVKFGGSVVTLKHLSFPAIRRTHLGRVAAALKKLYDPNRHALIFIHGAGSFGHGHAHKYDLALGTKDHPEKTFRAVENQALDAVLNTELTAIFIAAGLPVVGMPTRTLALNTKGELASLTTNTLAAALEARTIPLLHGDMVFDTTWGLSICSGDVLVSELARVFSVESVFFASDVDGIFSADPHRFQNVVLIKKMTLEEIMRETIKLDSSHNVDVTGGLSKKFSLFRENRSLKKIYLFNGLCEKNFSFLFEQKNFFGTTIETKKGKEKTEEG